MTATLALGPISKFPSWSWIGAGTAPELRRYFTVNEFSQAEIPAADVVLIVKWLPPIELVRKLKSRGSKIIYAPVDFFLGEGQIAESIETLKLADAIVVHSESLLPYLERYAPCTFIDHHDRFSIPEPVPYRTDGYAIWIGAFQNFPYLAQYLEVHPAPIEIRILTNLDEPGAVPWAHSVAKSIGASVRIEGNAVNGMKAEIWSAERQAQLLREARAAIDIKGSDFNQQTKPPTKAQKFICSGLPLAMNGSDSVRYFAKRGLMIPAPSDARWLSKEYYDEVQAMRGTLRPELSLERVGAKYKAVIESVL